MSAIPKSARFLRRRVDAVSTIVTSSVGRGEGGGREREEKRGVDAGQAIFPKWNFGIQQGRPVTVRENREWKPAVAYCRYADDFVVIVKGTKAHAEAIREECRAFLEGKLKLTLNMEKTHITHVNDGFVFLGHRIIRKRGSSGRMAVVTTIPKEKAKAFAHRLSMALSGDHDLAKVDMVDRLNRQLRGWAAFYKYTDFTATTFRHIDYVVFWKMAHCWRESIGAASNH
jgi:RNA-directed DNA polymerase